MRNLIFVGVLVCFIAACGSGTSSKKEREFEVKTTKTYTLVTELSKLVWMRQVDYKHLEKRMKIFGTYADVSLENIQLETNGEAMVKSGNLIMINDKYDAAEVEIDLTLTRFYSDDEESFFESESYEPAKLIIKSFAQDSTKKTAYNATGDLTMNGKTQEIIFPVDLSFNADSNIVFHGTYLMQTSEWPILKQPKPENINYDEISFGFDLIFGNSTEKVDTVYKD